MLPLLALLPAHANDSYFVEGFVIDTRTDAPTDAQLLVAANVGPTATVVSGPGAPFQLESERITGVGPPPRAVLWPPPGGWEPGATYTVQVEAFSYGDEHEVADELTFTVGTEAAGGAPAPVVGTVETTPWTEDQAHAWGCCDPTRRVRVPVDLPGADPWDRVELVGDFDFDDPSEITVDAIHEHLALELGAGPHVLEFAQWFDDGIAQPPCFDVVSVSAAGSVSASERRCVRDGPDETDETDETDGTDGTDGAMAGSGCSSAPGGLASMGWWVLALLARRRER